MHLSRYIISAALFIILCFTGFSGQAQLGFSFDIKKPDQYDDRVLGSEKSESKKFSTPRRFIQNTFTHYNYFFNANNKLNDILANAKSQHVDDYTSLLSFYNYSLDDTEADSIQLDSVIYKSTTGIVLHDLRNDWIDNLYLLTGAAYYLRKQFDSAYLTFQFINYAFAEKEKDGYYKNIGSRLDGNNAFTISTKEKNSLPKKVFAEPPSRNESFIWLIRTLIAQEEYAESASLIVTLKNDPVFPKRLHKDLEEVQAWWYYCNNQFDSAAVHLINALDNATNKRERSRWEFLIAQLYENSNNPEMAKTYYGKVISHTIDPVMEVYARLNSIRINKADGESTIDKNIAELQKMAKRDKYYEYRDVIYFTIAQMEMERNNPDQAQINLAKSVEYNTDNKALKNKAWIQMAEIAFAKRQYRIAANCYDSLDTYEPSLKDVDQLIVRKTLFHHLATQLEIVERQDSLQRIAAMNEQERKDYVKKLSKQIRKQQGLNEEVVTGGLVPIGVQASTQQTDLFVTNSKKGDWYFYNAALRKNGLSEFKTKWGNRPNVDNWRRSSGMNFQQANKIATSGADSLGLAADAATGENTYEAMYANLPLTEEKMEVSDDSISHALFLLGKGLTEDLEDCGYGIIAFERLVKEYPDFEKMDEVLFSLYYCYNKTGEKAKAAQVKKLMQDKYPGNRFTTIITTGKDPKNAKDPEATKAYENIYDLFIEGNFTKAIEEKAIADKKYGSSYWTPQLLYIESVYYIKQKQDDKASASLQKIISMGPGTPMAAKAQNMIDVLSRRKQIEEELQNLNVVRPKDEQVKFDTATIKKDTIALKPPPKIEPEKVQPQKVDPVVIAPAVIKKDSVVTKPLIAPFTYKADDKHYAVVLLNKTDLVWVNETKNAFSIYNRTKFYNKQFEYSVTEINPEYRMLLIGVFDNAQQSVDYVQAVKPVSNTSIVPWLKQDKYSFTIISAANLEILKTQKDVNLYQQFIEKNLPGKF